jgi:hypothetical protein
MCEKIVKEGKETTREDIHPTDLGYAVLGGLILGQYLKF